MGKMERLALWMAIVYLVLSRPSMVELQEQLEIEDICVDVVRDYLINQ